MPSHDSRTNPSSGATANLVQAEPLILSLIAGYRNDGEPVLEKIVVEAVTPASKEYRLLKSPAFVRSLAAGDRIRFPADNAAGYELTKRSGNLCIRVLVYSIHVSIGFQNIEILLERVIEQFPGTVWYYGNVYDPADGVTPLDWWQEFLAPV